jgi:hypothetical protein
MRCVSRDLNRVLVPVMMFLLQERRHRRLLYETLRRSASEIGEVVFGDFLAGIFHLAFST